jgi:hypothetical protein
MRMPRSTQLAALGLAVVALAPASAMAKDRDLRSPDARDAAAAAQRSVDLRSPDARDAADGRDPAHAPTVMVVKAPHAAVSSDGIDWSDVGIGAGGAVALFGIGIPSVVAAQRRRNLGGAARTAPIA